MQSVTRSLIIRTAPEPIRDEVTVAWEAYAAKHIPLGEVWTIDRILALSEEFHTGPECPAHRRCNLCPDVR